MTMKTSLMEGGGIENLNYKCFPYILECTALFSLLYYYLPRDTATLGPPLVGFKVCNSLNVEATLL